MSTVRAASVVLDTNVVLDLLVFADPSTQALRTALAEGSLQWLATQEMRQEFGRVLAYPRITGHLQRQLMQAGELLERFDAMTQRVERAAPSGLRCSDPDDQIFIDLALAHGAMLLSKDAAVLALRKRLAMRGVAVCSFMPPAA